MINVDEGRGFAPAFSHRRAAIVSLPHCSPAVSGIEGRHAPSYFCRTAEHRRRAMIRHLVLVRFREGVAQGEISGIFEELGSLRRHLPGMKSFAAGQNVSPEGLSHGHTHAFTVDFEDAAARDDYLALPAHEAAGARLVRAAEGGLAGLTVLDFAIP